MPGVARATQALGPGDIPEQSKSSTFFTDHKMFSQRLTTKRQVGPWDGGQGMPEAKANTAIWQDAQPWLDAVQGEKTEVWNILLSWLSLGLPHKLSSYTEQVMRHIIF